MRHVRAYTVNEVAGLQYRQPVLHGLVGHTHVVGQRLHVQLLPGARRRQHQKPLKCAQVVNGRQLSCIALGTGDEVALQPFIRVEVARVNGGGASMSSGVNLPEPWRRAALSVDKIMLCCAVAVFAPAHAGLPAPYCLRRPSCHEREAGRTRRLWRCGRRERGIAAIRWRAVQAAA